MNNYPAGAATDSNAPYNQDYPDIVYSKDQWDRAVESYMEDPQLAVQNLLQYENQFHVDSSLPFLIKVIYKEIAERAQAIAEKEFWEEVRNHD